MVGIRYKITQDRWCWCGAPAALLVTAKDFSKPVCSVDHGQRTITRLQDEEERDENAKEE